MYTAKLSLFPLIVLLLEVVLFATSVQGASLWNSRHQNSHNDENNDIAYRRYVRRRPSYYQHDLYMDEYIEVFYTRLRPPPYWLSDEEVDRIIRCDFNPNLEDCQQVPITPTVAPTLKPPTTTARNNLAEEATTRRVTPESTTRRNVEYTTAPSPPKPTATTAGAITTTPTEDLPFLPDISEEELEETTENDPNLSYEIEQNVNGNGNADVEADNLSYKDEDYDDDDNDDVEQLDNGL